MENNKQLKYYGDGRWIENSIQSTFEEADIVIMPGGSDWNPSLYGHTKINRTYYNDEVDERQLKTAKEAIKQGKFLFGICRGLI